MDFLLDLELNQELYNYIESNNIENKNKFINDIINLGFNNYKQKDENNLLNNINSLITNHPILSEIRNSTSEITKNFFKPISKGNYGENIISEYLSNKYQNYELIDTSTIPHSGDFQLNMNDINERIIVEVKTYNDVISRNQINKLIYDMEYTGINYSIFISLCSKIVGKKQNIEWEIFKNKEQKDNIIIFISDAHSNIDNIQIGLTILKSFIKLLNTQNVNENTLMYLNKFTQQSYITINKNVCELLYLKDNINQIKNNIYSLHDNISKQILELYHTFTIFDNEYNNKIKLLQTNLTQEFSNITNIIENSNDNNDIYLFLDTYKKNKNIYEILQVIISDLISSNYIFEIVAKNELKVECCKINILKTNINIVFNDGVQLKNININNWNKYKNLF